MTEWQLFRYGSKAYGFQYHAEVNQQLIEIMCRNNAEYMASNGFDAEVVIDESRKCIEANLQVVALQLLERWLNLCRGQDV